MDQATGQLNTCQKNAYPSKKAVLTAIRGLYTSRHKKRGRHRKRNLPAPSKMRAYYCHHCGQWHMTSKEYEPKEKA